MSSDVTVTIYEKNKRPKKKCVSLWLDEKEYADFQQNTLKAFGKKKTVSDRFNEFMRSENLVTTGQPPELSLVDAIDVVRQRLLVSFTTTARLGKLWTGKQKQPEKFMRLFFDFIASLGIIDRNQRTQWTPDSVASAIADEPEKLRRLYHVKQLPYNISEYSWEIFLEYMEEKVKQVLLKQKLIELRQRLPLDKITQIGDLTKPVATPDLVDDNSEDEPPSADSSVEDNQPNSD